MISESTKPLVTIGIPVYNEEKYIKETLLSAINQTYKNLEIIISDNCSTDSSLKVIHEVAPGVPSGLTADYKDNSTSTIGVRLAFNFWLNFDFFWN